MTTNDNSSTMMPDMNPATTADYMQWLEMQYVYQQDYEKLQAMLAALSSTGNPLAAAQMIMQQVTEVQGDQMGEYAAASNVISDLSNEVTDAQNQFNDAGNSVDAADQFVNDINQVEAFLQWQKSLGDQGENTVIGGSTVDSMLNAIEDLKGNFKMWNGGYVSMTVQSETGNPDSTSGVIGNVQNALQSMGQMLTGQSSMVNMQIEQTSNNLNSEYGTLNNTIQTQISLESNEVNNQRST